MLRKNVLSSGGDRKLILPGVELIMKKIKTNSRFSREKQVSSNSWISSPRGIFYFFKFFTFFLLFSHFSIANPDSLAVKKAKWKKQRIAPGIQLKHYFFDQALFNSNQNINILEIKPKRNIFLDVGFEPLILKPTSEFGKEANAIAAINGTFFNRKEGGSRDFIKAGGKIINENEKLLEEENQRIFHQKAAISFNNGKIKIHQWDGSPDWEHKIEAEGIMVSGPLLLINNDTAKLDSITFNITRHPRTVVAITKKNRILLITIDGRNENAAGMNLFELRKFLRWLNATDGLNLDGGGSTTLWVQGQPENGVVNYPTDNKTWDREGEREVANVVLVKKKK
jgi:exopolysaccharide biosynthesis protein